MSKKHEENEKLEKLRIENEIKKMKLSAEHGSNFFSSGNLPPEIENEWLKNIEEFESSWKNAKRVSVYEFLGKPVFKPLGDIPDSEIKHELDMLLVTLVRGGIAVGCICDVDDKELYRFITEELFYEETDDIHNQGFTTHFTYEEFHPNFSYDIREHAKDFVQTLTDYRFEDMHFTWLAKEIRSANGQTLNEKQVIKKIGLFRQAYEELTVIKLDFSEPEINETEGTAKLSLFLDYEAMPEGSTEKIRFSGNGELLFVFVEREWWCINGISLPGLKI